MTPNDYVWFLHRSNTFIQSSEVFFRLQHSFGNICDYVDIIAELRPVYNVDIASLQPTYNTIDQVGLALGSLPL